jgi:hypothetical protein
VQSITDPIEGLFQPSRNTFEETKHSLGGDCELQTAKIQQLTSMQQICMWLKLPCTTEMPVVRVAQSSICHGICQTPLNSANLCPKRFENQIWPMLVRAMMVGPMEIFI